MSRPSWLPEKFQWNNKELSQMKTEEEELVIKGLFKVFEKDFISSKPKLHGLPVEADMAVEEGQEYPKGFLHIITKDVPTVEVKKGKPVNVRTGKRALDIPRAERFPWCKPCIEHKSEILCWDFREGERNGKVRTYIWLKDFDYVIILQKTTDMGDVRYALITAFWIQYENMKEKLDDKWNNRLKQK